MKIRIRISIILFVCFFAFINVQAKVGYKTGNIAPGFSLKDLNGKKHSLSGLTKDKHVLLVFWAVECVYCYAHVKEFNKAHEQYKDKLNIVAINIDGEQDEQIREYQKDNKLKYLLLSDRLNNIDVAEKYRVLGTPTIVLVSPEGKVLFYGHHMPEISKWVK